MGSNSAFNVSQDIGGRANPNFGRQQSMSGVYEKIAGISQANSAFNAEQAQINRDWQAQQNKIAMDFNASEAAKSRDWQKMMSDTAHQREIKDLKAAGLNPVLSVMGGNGASVTSGATASGVTSSGGQAQADTSGSAALVSLLGSFLNAQIRLQEMNTNAITNLAVADKYTAMSKYTAELGAHTQLTTANINAAASRYAAQVGADATKVAASIHAAAQKYGYDVNAMTQKEIAGFNAQVNKELKQMGIDAQFDFERAFPSGITQAIGGAFADESAVLDWFSNFRDSATNAVRNYLQEKDRTRKEREEFKERERERLMREKGYS